MGNAADVKLVVAQTNRQLLAPAAAALELAAAAAGELDAAAAGELARLQGPAARL